MQKSSDMPIFFWIFLAFIAYSLISHAIEMQRRRRQMPRLAEKFGLKHWGDSLPPELPLDESELAPISRTFNVFEGSPNNVPTVIFDVEKRSGKGFAYFTVVAAKGEAPFGAEAFDPDLTTTRLGEWTLLYKPREIFSLGRRLLSMQQIEDQLRSVRPSSTNLQTKTGAPFIPASTRRTGIEQT